MRLDLVKLSGEEELEREVGQLGLVLPQPEPRWPKAVESAGRLLRRLAQAPEAPTGRTMASPTGSDEPPRATRRPPRRRRGRSGARGTAEAGTLSPLPSRCASGTKISSVSRAMATRLCTGMNCSVRMLCSRSASLITWLGPGLGFGLEPGLGLGLGLEPGSGLGVGSQRDHHDAPVLSHGHDHRALVLRLDVG